MRRLALCLVCTTIVAVFQVPLGAAVADSQPAGGVRLKPDSTSSQEIPIPGGTAAFAGAFAIDPVPDRGRFVSEITRLVYDNESRNPTAAAFLTSLRTSQSRGGKIALPYVLNNGPSDIVPLPLTAEIWSNAVFRRKVPPEDLFMTILADRQAALLCHGLAALDDETLQFFAEHASLVSRLYERHAPTFGVFSGSLHVRANRIVPAGDQAAVPLWEAVVGEKVTRPDRFVLTLFELNEGRLAYLYDIAGHVEAAHRAFVLGLWIKDATARLERFKQLATVGLGAFRDWHVRTMPYGRPTNDLTTVLTRVDVAEDGTPAPPAKRGWWMRVFASTDLPADAIVPKPSDDQPLDATWLAETVGGADVRQRGERLDQIAFGQRVFGGQASTTAANASAVFVALRALPQYRTLMLTLERVGVRAPAIYAAAARHASRLAPLDGRRGFLAQAQFQGAMALIARMAHVRTIDARTAASAIERLVSAPVNENGRYTGAIARWLQDDEDSILPPGNDVESALIAALGGAASADPTTPVTITWEGQEYRFDLGFAERLRLTRVRQKQEGLPIDVPLEIAGLARRVGGDSVSLSDVEAVVARLTKIDTDVPQSRHETLASQPAGVGAPADIHELLRKAIEFLTTAVKTKEPKRASRAAEPLGEAADELLAQALLSFTYAMYVGDPDGNVLLAGDVSYRHDFGFGMKDGTLRARAAWSVPRQDIAPGVPWHLSGSLLGLDVGLAPLALRRLNFDHLMHAPKLTSNERDAFATSIALMNPYALRDADRDAIADAVARGRARVLDVTKNPAGFDAVADAIAMEGARRRALRWTLDHEANRLPTMFSLAELMFLGDVQGVDVNAWGMSALGTIGCFCTQLALPPRWWMLAGRPQLGIVAAGMPDLTLHIAARLKELQMPAALARVVLSAAMQDFIDEVQPTDDSDWLTLARAAQAATREQVEDYLASATADGPLVPVTRKPQS